MLKRLPLCVVEGVRHQHRHRAGAGLFHRKDTFAPDDRVAGDLDQLRVDLEILDFRHQRQIREFRDEFGRILAAKLEFRVQHALHQRGGVFGHLLEEGQVLLLELAVGAGVDLLVEQLNCPDDDVGLQRHSEHRLHLEAGVHFLQRGSLRSLAGKEQGLAGLDDFADVARAPRQLHLQQRFGRLLELLFLGLVVAPQRGRVVDVPEVDLFAFEQVQGHRLALQLVDDLRCGEFDDRAQILAAGRGLGENLEE